MIIIITFISFILEYIANGFFHGSIFSGLIVLSTLILVEPYFKKNKDKFYIYCFVVGFLYDLVYTGTYFMNAGLFLVIGWFCNYFNSITSNNFIASIIKLIILIALYRSFTFLFLGINGIIKLDLYLLFKSIYSSMIVNIIYGIVLYLFMYLISKKFDIKRIK